jgi:hypothetical protein
MQEERSRLAATRLVGGLSRWNAPTALVDDAKRVTDDEARHVAICEYVVRALGYEPRTPAVRVAALPAGDAAFERAMTELLVAGFAVAETMSVGGFAAVRAIAGEPLMRWAFAELARDEVGHGRFGEVAGAWALRDWSAERRRSLWPVCVRTMEDFERRTGGPVGDDAAGERCAELEALGVPRGSTTGMGLLRSIPRWVLPRLARLGVLPERVEPGPRGRYGTGAAQMPAEPVVLHVQE